MNYRVKKFYLVEICASTERGLALECSILKAVKDGMRPYQAGTYLDRSYLDKIVEGLACCNLEIMAGEVFIKDRADSASFAEGLGTPDCEKVQMVINCRQRDVPTFQFVHFQVVFKFK
jgi:hypothetical protein